MKGIIITNAYSLSASTMQAERFQYEMEQLGVVVDIVQNGSFGIGVDGDKVYTSLAKYDFCIYLDKDIYIAKMLEKAGIKLFNSASAIEVCDDKMLTHITLSNHNIDMPKTIAGLLCYNQKNKPRQYYLDMVEKQLGYPIIIKECQGSWGKQVYYASNRDDLERYSQDLIVQKHLHQQFVPSSKGQDIRVIVVGGQAVASMKRVSTTDFRSNIELGGKGYALDLPKEYESVAIKTARVLGLDYCGVDLLVGHNNAPLVCEVNSNAFFETIEKVTNTNIAKLYCQYIINKIKN